MKKRSLLTIVAVVFISSLFTSCKEDELALLGYWKCTGVGGNVFGVSTGTIGENALKYFSIGYIGGTTGKYVRVGADDLPSSIASLQNISLDVWKEFLSAGSYTADADAGTITHTTTNGESKTYNYSVSGNTLKLTERNLNASSSSTVNSALDVLNSLLGTNATTSVGVEYTYEKLSKEDFNALFSKK